MLISYRLKNFFNFVMWTNINGCSCVKFSSFFVLFVFHLDVFERRKFHGKSDFTLAQHIFGFTHWISLFWWRCFATIAIDIIRGRDCNEIENLHAMNHVVIYSLSCDMKKIKKKMEKSLISRHLTKAFQFNRCVCFLCRVCYCHLQLCSFSFQFTRSLYFPLFIF